MNDQEWFDALRGCKSKSIPGAKKRTQTAFKKTAEAEAEAEFELDWERDEKRNSCYKFGVRGTATKEVWKR